MGNPSDILSLREWAVTVIAEIRQYFHPAESDVPVSYEVYRDYVVRKLYDGPFRDTCIEHILPATNKLELWQAIFASVPRNNRRMEVASLQMEICAHLPPLHMSHVYTPSNAGVRQWLEDWFLIACASQKNIWDDRDYTGVPFKVLGPRMVAAIPQDSLLKRYIAEQMLPGGMLDDIKTLPRFILQIEEFVRAKPELSVYHHVNVPPHLKPFEAEILYKGIRSAVRPQEPKQLPTDVCDACRIKWSKVPEEFARVVSRYHIGHATEWCFHTIGIYDASNPLSNPGPRVEPEYVINNYYALNPSKRPRTG